VQWLISAIPTTQEVETGRLQFETSQGKSQQDPILKNKVGVVVHVCNPAVKEVMVGGTQSEDRSIGKSKTLVEK
jgi:hypothetical protein